MSKKENLNQRAYLNAISAFLDYGVKALTGFILNPIILGGLGQTFFGVWSVLRQLNNYMASADMRATEPLKWFLARNRSTLDDEELQKSIGASLGVILLFSPLFFVAGGVIVWIAPLITKVSTEYVDTVRYTAGILISGFIISKFTGIFDSVLRGMNLDYKRMGLKSGLTILNGLLIFMVIKLNYGLIGLAAVQLFSALLLNVILWRITLVQVPWFKFKNPGKEGVVKFLGISVQFFLWTFTKQLLFSSDIILLSYFATPKLVTLYVITKYGITTITGILSNLIYSVLPGMGKIIGKHDYAAASALRKQITWFSIMFVAIVGSNVLIWNRSFVGLWVGHSNFAGYIENLFMVLIATQWIFINNDSVLINLTLDLKKKILMGLSAALITFLLSAFLIPLWGIAGLCLSVISGNMVLSIGYPYIVSKYLQNKIFDLSAFLRPLTVLFLLYAVAFFSGNHLYINNWLVLIPSAIGAIILASGMMFFAGLGKTERTSIISRFKKVKLFKIKDE